MSGFLSCVHASAPCAYLLAIPWIPRAIWPCFHVPGLSNASIIVGPGQQFPSSCFIRQGLTGHHRQYHAPWLPYLCFSWYCDCIWCSQSVHVVGQL